ncbi:MAG TPA: hypothetical protein VK629_09415 [Steroidobacteraceae bacterium]|nr:hypothetical protein [Steroidobacteraceae bacterium]
MKWPSLIGLAALWIGGSAAAAPAADSRNYFLSNEQFVAAELLACRTPHNVEAQKNLDATAVGSGADEEIRIDLSCLPHEQIEQSPVFYTATCMRKARVWSCANERRLMQFKTASTSITIESKKVPLKQALRAIKYVLSVPEFKGRVVGAKGVGSHCQVIGKKQMLELDCEHYRFYVDTTPFEGKPRLHLFEMVQ